jgi:NAD(P)-dependent dehydrogenase (short-subunit alcohol dehydrogenase family)
MIALVTGASKGIGFEICRLLKEKDFEVILTARDENVGLRAADDLKCVFHQLDVTDDKSVLALRRYVDKRFGKIDVLINNAAVLIDMNESILTEEAALFRKTFDTNFFGPLRMCQQFHDLINKGGRIINVSSSAGALNDMGTGFPAYAISKAALNGLTRKLAAELSHLRVNSMSPGWCRTDMGGANAPRSAEKGAETVVWLATEKEIPTGGFFQDKKEINW